MGQKVLIIGQSGTGKSTSLRNFDKDEVCLIKTIGKPLPFRGGFTETLKTDRVSEIISRMKRTDKKVIVIDDGQYIMGNEFFRRVSEKGWDKFNDIGGNFFSVLDAVEELPEDVIVYYLLHTEKDTDGNIKIKTIGKMLDEKLTIEGLATVVLMTNVVDGKYTFQTQNSGHDICKSPMGMFENFLIDNDLKMVDGIIREYYGLSDVKPEEKGVQAEKPTRRSRGQAVEEAPVKRERRPRTEVQEVAEQVAQETLKDIAGEPYVPTNDTIPPLEEETPKPRRSRKPVDTTEPVDDGLTTEERENFKAEMDEKNAAYEERVKELVTPKRKTLAEKMAEAGYETAEQPTPVRRRRIVE